MEPALKELLNFGALGVVLAAVLGIVLWMLRQLFVGILSQMHDFNDFMRELSATLIGIRDNCRACRTDSVAALRELEERVNARIDGAVATLQRNRLEERVDELSRPHTLPVAR
jgi:hypothetical protein